MGLTKHKSGQTRLKEAVANSWFGGLYGSEEGAALDPTDPQNAGHAHDGLHEDGHAQKIDLEDHVTNQLPLDRIQGTTTGSVLIRNGTSWQELMPGTNGYFLRTNGTGVIPSWAAGGGGGGDDTFTVPYEWHIDTAASDDATTRTYNTIAAALANASGVVTSGTFISLRLKDGQTHTWTGTSMPASNNVIIYSKSGQATLSMSNFSVSSNYKLLLNSLILSTTGTTPSISVSQFKIENCTGSIVLTAEDTPTVATVKTIDIDKCSNLTFGVTIADSGDASGTLNITRSRITPNNGTPGVLIDNTALLTQWDVNIKDFSFLYIDPTDTPAPASIIVIDTPDGDDPELNTLSPVIEIHDSTIYVILSICDVTISSTFYNIFRDKIKLIGTGQSLNLNKATQNDTSISKDGTYWTDVSNPPEGLIGFDPLYGGLSYFSSYINEWRGIGNIVKYTGTTNGSTTTATLSSVLDQVDNIGISNPGDRVKFSIKGVLTVSKSASADGAAFNIDIVGDLTSGGTYTILQGATPTAYYDTSSGAYDVTFVADTDGIRIDVDQASYGGTNTWDFRGETYERIY